MGSAYADEAKEKVTFAQGLQFFFVREILDKRYGRARLQSQDVGKSFFSTWSEIVCSNPKLPRTLSVEAANPQERIAEGEVAKESEKNGIPEALQAIPQPYQTLVAAPRYRSLLFLLQDTDLGELMRIPYPQAEALASQVAPMDLFEDEVGMLPLLGRVVAGQPLLAVENIEGRVPVEAQLARRNAFCLRVFGDSMVEDGILDGDIVVVDQEKPPRKNDIVVALVNGEVTVKHYHPDGKIVELRPANSTMRPMRIPARDVAVQGVVVALQRKS